MFGQFLDDFLEDRLSHLHAKRERKVEDLKAGGESAKVHSSEDITKIDFAIKRIQNGQYGICPPCGLPIGIDRLKKIPEALKCVECESIDERTQS